MLFSSCDGSCFDLGWNIGSHLIRRLVCCRPSPGADRGGEETPSQASGGSLHSPSGLTPTAPAESVVSWATIASRAQDGGSVKTLSDTGYEESDLEDIILESASQYVEHIGKRYHNPPEVDQVRDAMRTECEASRSNLFRRTEVEDAERYTGVMEVIVRETARIGAPFIWTLVHLQLQKTLGRVVDPC